MEMEDVQRFPVGFVAMANATRPYAVYCLLREQRVVYVGKSTNIYNRIGRHWQNLARMRRGKAPYATDTIAPIVFDSVVVKFVDRDDLDREELALIQRYLPQHNTRLKRPVPAYDFSAVPAVAEIINRVRRRQPPPFRKRQWSQHAA